MKKLISLVLCAVLLFSCMTFAQAETQQESTTAVDIVLLIDQSGSMHSTAIKNDPQGYRMAAAEMIIALLSMDNGSRVAFVPFAGRVYSTADRDFYEISSRADYDRKMQQCEAVRYAQNAKGPDGESQGGTDLAEALAYAYNLLESRDEGVANQPLIVLLTDGGLTIKDSSVQNQNWFRKAYYQWNEATGKYVMSATPGIVAATEEGHENADCYAQELLDDVVRRCRDKAYPVYTVAIPDETNAENKVKHYQYLAEIARNTGVEEPVQVTEDLRNLPEYFGDILAERIGSTELEPLRPVKNETTGRWEVEFVVPNKSLLEANLFVPLKGVEDIELRDPRGYNVADNGRTVMIFETTDFVLCKLRFPSSQGQDSDVQTGVWCLSFEADEAVAREVSFNRLYNYDVLLHGSVAKENAPNAANEFQRSDVLVFSGKFWDDGEGMYSEDVNLYRYDDNPNTTADDGFEMRATYKLYRVVNGDAETAPIKSGNMNFNPEHRPLQYTVELDMKAILQENGKNALPAGDYVMKLEVEGCGMERAAEIPFALNNTAPAYAGRTITKTHKVDETPNDFVATWDLSEYIKDEDNDVLTTRFVSDAVVGEAVTSLEYNPNTMVLTSTALDEDNDGKHDNGQVTGKLIIVEQKWGITTEIPVTVNLQSMSNALAKENIPSISVVDKATGAELTKNTEDSYVLAKNTTYEIKVKLQKSDGRTNRDDADQLDVKIAIYGDYNNIAETLMNTSADDKGVFTYEYTTGSKLGNWEIRADVYQKSLEASPLRSDEAAAVVENHKPTLKNFEEDKLEYTIYHNPLPEFLSFLGRATPEEDRSINLVEFFEDADNETLAYKLDSAPSIHLLTIEGEDTDSIWVMHPVEGANSSTEFIVHAYDNDNEQTDPIVFKVRLVDLVRVWTERGLIALAALIVLIILILIIRQIRKPKFPRGAVLGVREGNSDYDTNTYEFVPSKKPISLAAVVMADTAAKFGITANALTNIELVPVRSANYSIGVRLKKRMDDVTVGLSSKSIGKGKKPTVWVPGDALILNSRNNTTGSELNVVLDPPEISGPIPTPDPDPFQVNDVSGFGGFNNDVDVFGANDVSGSYGGMTAENFNTASAPVDTGFSMPVGDDNNVVDTYASDDTPTDTFTIDGF